MVPALKITPCFALDGHAASFGSVVLHENWKCDSFSKCSSPAHHEEPETIVSTSPRLRLIVGRYPKHLAWQSQRDSDRPSGTGRGLCCSFCGWKEIRSSSYDGLSGTSAILTLHLEPDGKKCVKGLEWHFINSQKNINIFHWSLDRSYVFSYNLTMSSWPWDTSRWPELRIFSSSWPVLSLDSKIWKKHKLETSLEQNVTGTWGELCLNRNATTQNTQNPLNNTLTTTQNTLDII